MIGKQQQQQIKGKPKTKTKTKNKKKLVETLISIGDNGRGDQISCKCYDPRIDEEVISSKREKVKAGSTNKRSIEKQHDYFSESNKKGNNENANCEKKTNNPLISINLATTATTSSKYPQKVITSVAKTNQIELDAAAAGGGECSLLDKRQSIGDSNNNNNNNIADQETDYSTATICCNVNDVKRNFITLVRYNKLQYFFLGTLIYSVINICFIFYALLEVDRLPDDDDEIENSNNYNDDNKNNSNNININYNDNVKEQIITATTTTTTRESISEQQRSKFNYGYVVNNERDLVKFICLFGQSMVPFNKSSAKFLLTINLPAMLALALVAALTTLQFGFKDRTGTGTGTTMANTVTTTSNSDSNLITTTTTTTSSNDNSSKKGGFTKIGYLMSRVELPLQSIGLILALILLYLPFISSNLSSIFFLIGKLDVIKENFSSPSSLSSYSSSTPSSYLHPNQTNNNNNDGDNTLTVSLLSQNVTTNTSNNILSIFDNYNLIVLLLSRLPIPPIVPLLALIYLQPLLLEGTSLNAKFVSTFTVLPLFILALARFWSAYYILPQILLSSSSSTTTSQLTINNNKIIIDSELEIKTETETDNTNQTIQSEPLERHLVASECINSNVFLVCLILILILGLLKRKYFVKIVTRDTFSRASQLIEAKVSLEHQRQQQETLLLSVLPAYVAEQVKRNMLKKTTTTGGGGSCSISANNLDFQQTAAQQQDSSSALIETNNNSHCQQANNNNNNNLIQNQLQGGSSCFLAPQSNTLTSSPSKISALFSSSTYNFSTNINIEQNLSKQQQQQQQLSVLGTGSKTTAPTPVSASPNVSLKRKLSADNPVSGTVKLVQSAFISALSSNQAKSSGAKFNFGLTNTNLLSESLVGGGFNSKADSSSGSPKQPSFNNNNFSSQIVSSPLYQSMSSAANLSGGGNQSRRGFNELYIRTYNNVSLLYGDIVGFTRLCTQLSSSQLVRVLNDLFSHFDLLAEKHKIMRIKILGDCYYGVSGIPEFAVMGAKSRATRNDNHAINCVNMGLDMIHYIKRLNVERASTSENNTISHSVSSCIETTTTANTTNKNSFRENFSSKHNLMKNSHKTGSIEDNNSNICCYNKSQKTSTDSSQSKLTGILTPLPAFELNMRIGVHSGHIHSGVIGLKKWQFDVWSNDVSIAMHCESSGIAGRVQVTEATIQQLNGAFTYEKALGAQKDSFLASKDICTYLIRDRVQTSLSPNIEGGDAKALANERMVAAKKKKQLLQQQQQQQQQQRRSNSRTGGEDNKANISQDEENIRAATIGTIKQTLLAGDTCNASGSNSYGLAINHHDISPILLRYQDSTISRLYSHRRIDNLVQEMISLILLLIIFLPLISFKLINNPMKFVIGSFDWYYIMALLAVSLLTLVNFLPKLNTYDDSMAGNGTNNFDSSLTSLLKEESSSSSNKTTPLKDNHQYSENANKINQTKQNVDDRCEGKDLPNITTKCIGWSRKQVLHFYGKFYDFIQNQLIKILVMEIRKSRLRSIMVILLFIIVILVQFYLVLFNMRNCNRMSSSPTSFKINNISKMKSLEDLNYSYENVASNEQYYLTVILLLISVELSVNLLSYKAKCLIIMGIVCLHFLFILKPILILQESDIVCHKATNKLNSLNELKTTPTHNIAWDRSLNNHEGDDNSNDGYSNRNDNYNRHDRRIRYIQLITNEQLINWSSNALLFVMALWSLAFARQLEYTKKTNFLWRNRLNVDHEELEYISGINKVLLENILPSHVVQYYLTNPNSNQGAQQNNQLPNLKPYMRMSFSNIRTTINNELYHEQHDSVAVMFASIPHFYEFYDESDISKQGLGCIALLNEIICDFDKLLLKNKFSRIEKIKTIGSTYMAAAGLRPCNLGSRSSNASQQIALRSSSPTTSRPTQQLTCDTESNSNCLGTTINNLDKASAGIVVDERKLVMSQQKLNLICMIQFATSLMTALNGINKQSFQVFKLRVGVNTGQVIAGVIGAQRPFYDIWGDCVNIASRMESLGEVGRIQVEETTAKLLLESLCTDTYSIVRRGPIDVKGKGGMVTYFVDKKVSGDEKQQQQHLKIDKAYSNGKCSSSSLQTKEDSNQTSKSAKVRKPSEPECGVRVTITSDTEEQQQQQVRRKSLDPTC